jgi:flagellar motor switch protein FliN/FliY
MTQADPTTDALALAAAEAAAAVLPAAEPLLASAAQPGTEHVTGLFAGAAVTDVGGAVSGRIAVLVGEELMAALASSPLGGLDLAAAAQPALDAAAAVLGAAAGAARQVELELVLADLGGDFTVVPLIGSGVAAALLLPVDALARAAGAGPGRPDDTGAAGPVFEADPVASPAPPAPPAVHAVPDPSTPVNGHRGIEMLHGVDMEVTVELGRTRMAVRDLLALAPGAVLELDRAAGSPADLLVNGRLIARGEVVVVDEDFGLRVTQILDESAAS